MSFHNLASVELPASFFREPTLDELKANIASFLARSKALAEAEERKEREARELEERNEFWMDIKREAALLGLKEEEREAREAKAREAKEAEAKAKEAREAKAREAKEAEAKAKEAKEETREAIEARQLIENDIFWNTIKREAALLALKEEEREAKASSNALNKIHSGEIEHVDDMSTLAGYKRKSKHYKSKHYKSKHYKSKRYKKNRRIHKKTKKHVS